MKNIVKEQTNYSLAGRLVKFFFQMYSVLQDFKLHVNSI